MDYSRILFPDRAEYMRENDKVRKGYRVFLEHWPKFIDFLKKSYERVARRKTSYALTIYGSQGVGKTLLADKLKTDLQETLHQISSGNLTYDGNNLWHLLTCGANKDIKLIRNATVNSELFDVSDEINWIDRVSDWSKTHPTRTKVVILDNAERAYFGAALAGLDPAEFIDRKSQKSLTIHIAQQFVKLARSSANGTLFIILGNDEEFLKTFYETCESQHQGMVVFENLPLPTHEEKETIVRININRLNKVSYWSCIDKSGPKMKQDLYNKLAGTATFPETFTAVDDAFADAQSRRGRPANKCLLSLVVITKDLTKSDEIALYLARKTGTDEIKHDVAHLYVIPENFCQTLYSETDRVDAAQMLESEFTLRLIMLSELWVSQLLGDAAAKTRAIDCLKTLLEHYRVGQSGIAISNLLQRQIASCDSLVGVGGSATKKELENFWQAGARRSGSYEPILKTYFPGYNSAFCQNSNKRPDILIERFVPCAVLSSVSDASSDINKAISRNCHAVEFTAQASATPENVSNYLFGKLSNYIDLVKEL